MLNPKKQWNIISGRNNMGGGFSCTAKGGIKAGDKFELSGEIQMEARGQKQSEENKEEKQKED